VSALPPDFAGSNFCSEILVSADGKFAYAGNRLHDTISFFSIDEKGELSYIDEVPTYGNYPRSFSFDPTSSFVYCCNQRGDNITIFEANSNTGRLSFTGQYVPVGNPSMIVFLDLAKSK
jgi:6-phosphogluconolactonase (cycloisomerase 2 family)